MISRGLIKQTEVMEHINLKPLYFHLLDNAIELEIRREFFHDLIVLIADSNSPKKFAILDDIQKMYDVNYKTSFEKLMEDYNRVFKKGESRIVKARIAGFKDKQVSDFVKRMPQK